MYIWKNGLVEKEGEGKREGGKKGNLGYDEKGKKIGRNIFFKFMFIYFSS